MKSQQSITSLPVSPADDRRKRMIQYTVAMTIRVICVLLLFVVQGWWLIVVGIGAIVLPYIAVVLANNVAGGAPTAVERPGGLVPLYQPDAYEPRAFDPRAPQQDAGQRDERPQE